VLNTQVLSLAFSTELVQYYLGRLGSKAAALNRSEMRQKGLMGGLMGCLPAPDFPEVYGNHSLIALALQMTFITQQISRHILAVPSTIATSFHMLLPVLERATLILFDDCRFEEASSITKAVQYVCKQQESVVRMSAVVDTVYQMISPVGGGSTMGRFGTLATLCEALSVFYMHARDVMKWRRFVDETDEKVSPKTHPRTWKDVAVFIEGFLDSFEALAPEELLNLSGMSEMFVRQSFYDPVFLLMGHIKQWQQLLVDAAPQSSSPPSGLLPLPLQLRARLRREKIDASALLARAYQTLTWVDRLTCVLKAVDLQSVRHQRLACYDVHDDAAEKDIRRLFSLLLHVESVAEFACVSVREYFSLVPAQRLYLQARILLHDFESDRPRPNGY
jgi:hypothetical protein